MKKKLQKLYEEVESESDFFYSESDGETEEIDNLELNKGNDTQTNEQDVENDEEASDDEVQIDEEVPLDGPSKIGDQDHTSDILLSKNRTRWSKIPNNNRVRTRADNIITHLPCVKALARDKKSPVDCWSLFITDNMVNDIVKYTNTKIAAIANTYNNEHQYLTKPTTAEEIKALCGLLYFSGL